MIDMAWTWRREDGGKGPSVGNLGKGSGDERAANLAHPAPHTEWPKKPTVCMIWETSPFYCGRVPAHGLQTAVCCLLRSVAWRCHTRGPHLLITMKARYDTAVKATPTKSLHSCTSTAHRVPFTIIRSVEATLPPEISPSNSTIHSSGGAASSQ